MRTIYAAVLILTVLGAFGTRTASTADAPDDDPSRAAAAQLEEAARKLGISIQHRRFLLLRFKPDVGEDGIEAIELAIKALPSKIDVIRTLEWGRIDGPQDANDEFTHCVLMSFDSGRARDALADHAAYQEFERELRPHLDDSIVIDYRPAGRYWRPSRPIDPEDDLQ
jgi:Stress responsive A/B Barrel Domain